MRKTIQLLPVMGICLLLISATCVIKKDTAVINPQSMAFLPAAHAGVKTAHKLNFFQRLLVRVLVKKRLLQNGVNADKLASTSLVLGITACGLLLLGLVLPYLILGSIPAGIAAMITGSSAIRNKTTLVGKATTGKALGLGALIAFGILLIIAIIAVASWAGTI